MDIMRNFGFDCLVFFYKKCSALDTVLVMEIETKDVKEGTEEKEEERK